MRAWKICGLILALGVLAMSSSAFAGGDPDMPTGKHGIRLPDRALAGDAVSTTGTTWYSRQAEPIQGGDPNSPSGGGRTVKLGAGGDPDMPTGRWLTWLLPVWLRL